MSQDFPVTQEADVVRARRLTGIGVAGAVITIVSLVIAGWLLGVSGRGREHGAAEPAIGPPELGTIEQTLVLTTQRGIDLRNAQRESLDAYGWVDRDAGIAKIPIERAMDIVAEGAP
jgi:hypothetical protein